MINIENALGKKIQITNSSIYSDLKDKIDPYFGLDYENLLFSLGNLSFALGKYVDADPEKIKFYVSLYGLGCVDGGKVTLDYFNSNLGNPANIITSFDIMLRNLKEIFPDMEQKFSNEQLNEFSQLFYGICNTKETQVIRIIYCLKLISQNYKKAGKFDDKGSTEFIFNEIERIIENYKKTGQLGISNELYGVVNNLYSQKYELNDVQINNLNEIIKNYNINLDKQQTIAKLNNLKSEKKTKIR